MTRKKINQKITKVTRLPGNAVVMSMMAVILVCAAPALVSVIDDSVNEEYDMPLSPEFIDPLIYLSNMRLEGEPVAAADVDMDIIKEDNVISILSSTPGYTGILTTFTMDKAIVNDTSKIVITTPSEYSSITIEAGDHDVYSTYDSELGQYIFSLSSIDRHYIMETKSDYLEIRVINTYASGKTFATVETFTIDVYGSVMIPYDEIIIGATGFLLIVCAILATPWVSTSGFTVKKRRR